MEGSKASSAVESVVTREIDEYSRLVSDRFAPLKIGSDRPGRFTGAIRGRRLGEIEIFDVRANQHEVERPQPLANRTPKGAYMLHLQLSGVGVIRQEGREAVLQTGDLAFYDSDRAYSLSLDDRFRNAILVFPQHLLTLPAESTNQLAATKISGRHALTGVVAPFLTQLIGALEFLPALSGRRLARNAVDLIATVIHAELGGVAPGAPEPSRRPSLLRQVRAYIDDNLTDPSLDPQQVAAAHFISVRTLHTLFKKEEEMGVAEWIRTRRLKLCRDDLSSPLQDYLPISAVAARHGFINPPHFSRLFKATFGESPAEFRLRSQATSSGSDTEGCAPSPRPDL